MMMSVLFWIPELKTLYIIHTWPPLEFCVDPALMNFPLVELSPLSKQWAADKRVNLSKMVAPQWCEPNFCTETCHGMGEGAGWPPTISLGSNRLVPVMKGGIVATKEMKLWRLAKKITYSTVLPQSPFFTHLSNFAAKLQPSLSQKQIASPLSALFLHSQNSSGPLVWKIFSPCFGNAQP